MNPALPRRTAASARLNLLPLIFAMPVLTAASGLLSGQAPPDQSAKIRPTPHAKTLAASAAIGWRPSLAAALEESAKSGRPVLWFVPTVAGTRMDRKLEVELAVRAGPLADPILGAFIRRCFVPTDEAPSRELTRTHKLQGLQFVEPGLIVFSSDGSERLRIDRISTLSAPWWHHRLHAALTDEEREATAWRPASKPTNALQAAEQAFAAGDFASAERWCSAVDPVTPGSDAALHSQALAAGISRWANAPPEELVAASHEHPALSLEAGRTSLALGRPQAALNHFDAVLSSKTSSVLQQESANYVRAVSLFLTRNEAKALQVWEKLAAGDGPYAGRSMAEVQGYGPVRRLLQTWEQLPVEAFADDLTGTCAPFGEERIAVAQERSVRFLLQAQRADGRWTDSIYDYGGTDSLPNVHLAVTALCARALHAHRDLAPEAIDDALQRAHEAILDRSLLALTDKDELAWAWAYRLDWLATRMPELTNIGERKRCHIEVRATLRSLLDDQLESGSFRHEYANPFVTASCIQSLVRARAINLPVPPKALEQAAAAIERTRADDGTFGYSARRRGARTEGSAGRMPLCELALFLTGKSSPERLLTAIQTARKHEEHLLLVRKLDDHADRYGNGGFFFWYDKLARAEAIAALPPEFAAEERRALRKLVLSLTEIDGTFIDSHEIGRAYGTALGLLTLKLTED